MEKWSMKTTVYVVSTVTERFKQFHNQTIFLVIDPFLEDSLAVKEMHDCLARTNQVLISTKVIPDPSIEIVVSGVQDFIEATPTVVIAVGGGSAIDTAKGIIHFYRETTKNEIDYFIAVPTTSGTGSEVTSATVITDVQQKIKYPLFTEELLPDEAILDPKFVLSCPPSVTAYSGLDVLTHALEALVSKNRTTFSAALAEKAIEITCENLITCVKEGKDIEARKQMHEAASLAGIAFDNAGLGVCHALAHQVGAIFKVPHGLANALLLPYVIEANSQDEAARAIYAQVARKLQLCTLSRSDETAVIKLQKFIKNLVKQTKSPSNLTDFGVAQQTAQQVAEKVAMNAQNDLTYSTNPVAFDVDELKAIYSKII